MSDNPHYVRLVGDVYLADTLRPGERLADDVPPDDTFRRRSIAEEVARIRNRVRRCEAEERARREQLGLEML